MVYGTPFSTTSLMASVEICSTSSDSTFKSKKELFLDGLSRDRGRGRHGRFPPPSSSRVADVPIRGRSPTAKSHDGDKTAFKKNWFDVKAELPKTGVPQRNAMVSTYIKKIDSYGDDDITKLLFILRVRALILIFFGLENIEMFDPMDARPQGGPKYGVCHAFLSRDVANHGGWSDHRSPEEDEVISGYQYAYALSAAGDDVSAGRIFTEADEKFGKIRHAKYLLTLTD